MKIKVTKIVCDSCQRDGFLQGCLICHKKYCVLCMADLGNPYGLNVCKLCAIKPKIYKILTGYHAHWKSMIIEGNKKLKRTKKAR
jgi:hypothetical protein